MAYLEELRCDECGKSYQGCRSQYGYGDLCSECYEIKKDTEYKKWMLDRRNGKTLEQRIEWIEEWIYANRDLPDHEHHEMTF